MGHGKGKSCENPTILAASSSQKRPEAGDLLICLFGAWKKEQ